MRFALRKRVLIGVSEDVRVKINKFTRSNKLYKNKACIKIDLIPAINFLSSATVRHLVKMGNKY